jgi:hypothetical protein
MLQIVLEIALDNPRRNRYTSQPFSCQGREFRQVVSDEHLEFKRKSCPLSLNPVHLNPFNLNPPIPL